MARLVENSYGKSAIRLTKVVRQGAVHSLYEFTVQVMLGGTFDRIYTHGDNSACIPTDTMKNTVYALARERDFASPEAFARILADHFLEFDQVNSIDIEIDEDPWARIPVDGSPHPHAFTRSGSGTRICRLAMVRGGAATISGGLLGLEVIKTTRSGFAGFFKDRYTTLPETADRIFATKIDAVWEYAHPDAGSGDLFEAARCSILEAFARHDSASVQQTIYAIGEALLARLPEILSVNLTMPNQHRLLVNLKPFGLDNANEIFVATDEPYGLIKGTVTR